LTCGVRRAAQPGEVVSSIQLKALTKGFALAIVRLVDEFPNRRAGWVIGDQLMRSGTSVGANYRAASRARSRREFIAKMGIVEEEADESEYWLELAVDAGLVKHDRVVQLRDDARHIVAKTVLSIRRARGTPLNAPHATRRTLGPTLTN
jgi:four helix bundle protein